jgi:F-box/leucine-rich repeat protein 10/11
VSRNDAHTHPTASAPPSAMRKFTILKPQYRQLAERPATPPAPPYEPLLSPPPAAATSGDAAHPRYHDRDDNGDSATAHQQRPEPLANAAVAAQRPSPAYAEHARRASYAAPSPTALPHPAGDDETYALPPDAAYTYAYAYDGRPTKRARSEFYSASSPTYGQQHSRPATSHNPGWSYNVEHMAEAGTRMYEDKDNGTPAPKQEHNPDKRLSDAQLLLDFFQVSAHTAQTPPSTAKRLSISQVAPAFAIQYPPLPSPHHHHQNPPHLSPHAAHAQHHVYHAQQPRAPSDVAHVPEPPSLPTDATLPAPAVQTRTPPEDNSAAQPAPPMSNTAAPEDAKPKKHQGWPKGKPRGPRNTPSSSKRKRATPKPKNAPSANSKGALDQFQPALSNDVAVAATATDTSASSSANVTPPYHQPSGARRHSFSNSFLVSPTTDTPSAAVRAQSVPLQILPSTAPPAADTSRRPKAQQPAEPDLICASCKSSDSEVKVGDGEQWIGCDGCKEWYHYACAGFNSEREVRDVNKFYCEPCRPKFGQTTSRSTDAFSSDKSDLTQRFANLSERTPPSITLG